MQRHNAFISRYLAGNLKGAGSVRQDLPMHNLDLGNIAENKRSPTLSVRFLEYPCETAPLFFFTRKWQKSKYQDTTQTMNLDGRKNNDGDIGTICTIIILHHVLHKVHRY